jgi:hypothetical protein
MEPGFELICQQGVDRTVPVHAAHGRESRCLDADAEMGSLRAVEGAVVIGAMVVMAGMEMTFVDHCEPLWREGVAELSFDF